MAGPFGLTFAPTDDAATEAQAGQPGRRQQAAVKVLTLMPPAVYSPHAFAANQLLQAPKAGLGADPNKAVLASIIRTLLGPDAGMPQAVPSELAQAGSFTAAASAPHIRDENVAKLPNDGSAPVVTTSPDIGMAPTGEPPPGPFGRSEIFDRSQPDTGDMRDMAAWRDRKDRPRTMGVYEA